MMNNGWSSNAARCSFPMRNILSGKKFRKKIKDKRERKKIYFYCEVNSLFPMDINHFIGQRLLLYLFIEENDIKTLGKQNR